MPTYSESSASELTKLEYFAARVLQALVTQPGVEAKPALDTARAAVIMAEQLIAALNEAADDE